MASKLRVAALDRFKKEAFTLLAPTDEINPNPTSPDTPQIPHPVPSSSVTQPTSSSATSSRPKMMTPIKRKNIQTYELS